MPQPVSIIERLSARGRVGGSTVNFSVGLVHFVLDLIQQIEKVSQQESELHKTTIQLSCMNLIILCRKPCINCPIVGLHYQFFVARLLQSAVAWSIDMKQIPSLLFQDQCGSRSRLPPTNLKQSCTEVRLAILLV